MDEGPLEERKLVTVLFADLVDSTALAESIDPERLRRLLETYFRAMAEIIDRWGGTIQKYIGDAIMAVFGVPAVREDDAERGVRAAMAMLDRLASLNDELEARHGVRLNVRIGVNTGDVIAPAGEIGASLIVAGDAVNVAARLQAAASPNAVLAGPRTHDAARTAVEFGDPVDLALKGKSELVRAWPVLGAKAEPVRGIPGLRAPMVGRDPELATLRALLDEAVERSEPRLALVYGPPGIGKSRLVAELTAAATETRGGRLLRGRSLAVGQGGTYWALTEILRSIAGGASPDQLRHAVTGPLAALGLDPGETERTILALGITAGIDIEGSPTVLEPERVGQELQLAWPRLASALALDGPLLLVLEDLHWAGDPLLEVLSAIVTRSTGPVLLLGTARPELVDRHPSFLQAREDTASVTLRPLSDAASGELIERLLDIAELPTTLRADLVVRAEGNPFFLEEMLRRLIDEGAIVEEGGRWRATAVATTVRLPDSIHGLLAARIDSLSPPAKALLREASVVGRSFWLPAIEAATNGSTDAAISELEGRGLVTARPISSLGSIAEYQFRHVLIRDVAYGSVPKGRRGRAHAVIGAWLEGAAGDRHATFAEAIADHYREALLGEDADLAWMDDDAAREPVRARALEALIAAGEGARRVNALARALDLHEAALELAATPAERARAFEAIGDDAYSNYQPARAIETFRAALDDARAEGRRADVARVAMKLARVPLFRAASDVSPIPLPEVDALLDEALAADPEPRVRSDVLSMSGSMALHYDSAGQDDPRPIDARVAAAAEGVEIAEALDDIELLIGAYIATSNLAFQVDDFDGIRASAQRFAALASRTTDAGQLVGILTNLANLTIELGGPTSESYAVIRRAAALTPTSRHSRLHTTAMVLAIGHRAGRWAELEPFMEEHLREAPIEGLSCPIVRLGVEVCGTLSAMRGRRDLADRVLADVEAGFEDRTFMAGGAIAFLEARRDLDRAREMALGMFARLKRPWTDDALGPTLDVGLDLGLERADWSLVERFLPRARERVAAMASLAPAADRAEGAMLAAGSDKDRAHALLERAFAEFDRLEIPYEVARTARLLAAASEADTDEAGALLARAASIEAELGIPPGTA
jgi:class 3 adenylate cyclase/tetratricopeptide (TPR) repeat protein